MSVGARRLIVAAKRRENSRKDSRLDFKETVLEYSDVPFLATSLLFFLPSLRSSPTISVVSVAHLASDEQMLS